MTPHVIAAIIAGAWALVLIAQLPFLVHDTDGYMIYVRYGACIAVSDTAIAKDFLMFLLPGNMACLIAVLFNVYVAVRVYYIHKSIDNEAQCSGVSTTNEVIKQKSTRIKKYMKPIIVILSGGIMITIGLSLLYVAAIPSPFYRDVVVLIVNHNALFAIPLLHPLVYGLYFKQIRQPMMKRMKALPCWSKFNTTPVAPQMPRTAWM